MGNPPSDLPTSRSFAPEPTLTGPQAAARAGLDYDVAKRFWRALGMPETSDDDVVYADGDVEALKTLRAIAEGGLPFDEQIRVTRLYGRGLAAIADAETRLFRERLVEPAIRRGAPVEETLRPIVQWLLDQSATLLDHAHRRHLAIALDALSPEQSPTERLAAGFADLVDFSRISDDLPGEELGDLVDRFEEIAVAVCADSGVRLVKVIGDAVMFVSPEPERALAAARGVVDGAESEEVLPPARAGLDLGDVVAVGGDYFGRPVNVAARVTAFALPGTVVVSDGFLGGLPEDSVETSEIRSQRLKGVGRVKLYKVRGQGSEA